MIGNGTATHATGTCACRNCGATAPLDQARITGVWSVVDDRAVWDCEGCTRDHLHDIEAGLGRGRW